MGDRARISINLRYQPEHMKYRKISQNIAGYFEWCHPVATATNIAVDTVSADGLVPSGARTSADTLMTQYGSHIDTGLALERFYHTCICPSV